MMEGTVALKNFKKKINKRKNNSNKENNDANN